MSAAATRVAIVTGAGSGVGRAVTHLLAGEGWQVAAVARTERHLQATRAAAPAVAQPRIEPRALDVRDRAGVQALVEDLAARHQRLDLVVNAAGTNTPRRSLAEVSWEDYRRIVDTNLDGCLTLVLAALPIMRRQQAGQIINIVSLAGLRASALSGVAYVVSKFGLAGLTQSINAEENVHGIRATAIFPGDIATPLLEQRPQPPPAAARAAMLSPEDVARCVALAVQLGPHAVIDELVVRPRVPG